MLTWSNNKTVPVVKGLAAPPSNELEIVRDLREREQQTHGEVLQGDVEFAGKFFNKEVSPLEDANNKKRPNSQSTVTDHEMSNLDFGKNPDDFSLEDLYNRAQHVDEMQAQMY